MSSFNESERNCPFRIGEKIVTLEPNYIKISENNFKLNDYAPMLKSLTRGKIYEVIKMSSDYFAIMNDHGTHIIPSWHTFIILIEYRKIKLNELSKIQY